MLYLVKNKWWELNKDYNIEIILFALINRPKKIYPNNKTIWNDKNYDLPSLITSVYSLFWYKNGKLHREGKPAVILLNGNKEYWIENQLINLDYNLRLI